MGEGAKPGSTFNGAYYSGGRGGGPIPSPATAHKLPRRRQSLCCGPICIFRFLLKLVITLIIVAGVAELVIWLALRSSKPKFYVDSVQMNNIANSSSSNILLGMSIRNANKRIGIYYKEISATAHYGGSTIGVTALEDFYQGHKNTTTLHPVFYNSPVLLSSDSEGVAAVEVKLRSRIRLKVGKVKIKRYTLKVNCRLSVPVNATSGAAFTRKKCKVKLRR